MWKITGCIGGINMISDLDLDAWGMYVLKYSDEVEKMINGTCSEVRENYLRGFSAGLIWAETLFKPEKFTREIKDIRKELVETGDYDKNGELNV